MAMAKPEVVSVRFVKKMSALFRAADEKIHAFGSYREHVKGKQFKYCFVGLIQCKGGFYQYDDSNGMKPRVEEHEAFLKFVPKDMREKFTEMRYKCPAAGQSTIENEKCAYGDKELLEIRTLLVHLNDNHNWTFKQGADFLESMGL